MSQLKKTSVDPESIEDECSEPESTVRAKAKPLIDVQVGQIAADWKAGRLTADQAFDKAIAANCAWASPHLSPERQAQLKSLLRLLVDTDPFLLKISGRDK